MLANSVENKNNLTDECLAYCTRGIVQLLNGNTEEFNNYVTKAIDINKKFEKDSNIINCKYKLNGKKIEARINMLTKEIKDLQGNVLKEGVHLHD